MRTKRFLAALLAAVMTFTCMGAVAFAALPQGAAYDYDFNDPSHITKITPYSNVREYPTGWSNKLANGQADVPTDLIEGKDVATNKDDKSWRFCIGYGNGGGTYQSPDEAQFHVGYANGARVGLGGNKLKDTTVVFDMDFKIGAKTVWAAPFLPIFEKDNGSEVYPISLQVREGVLTVSGVEAGYANGDTYRRLIKKDLGEFNAKEWHNIGAVIQHSSTGSLAGGNSTIIDLYVDSVKVYTYETKATAYKKGVLTGFYIPALSTATVGSPGRYDSRGEYVYIDNFYLGDDISRVRPVFAIQEMIPSSSPVAVDADIQAVLNQPVANAVDVSNGIWLTAKNSPMVNFANVIADTTYEPADTLTGVLSEKLYYSEDYTLNVSGNYVNAGGKKLDNSKTFNFRTDTMFPVKAEADITTSDDTVTAILDFDGNDDAMKLVMATYAQDGTMVEVTVQDIAANESGTSISVTAAADETVKIFAVDGFDTGVLVMEPIIVGEAAKSYKQDATTLSMANVTTHQKVISVDARSNTVRGWVLGKIAIEGDEDSADIADYLTVDAVQADDNGNFKFAGRVEENTATYVYKAIAPDSLAEAEGEVEYVLETGNDLLSLTLGGKKCTYRNGAFYLDVKDTDVRGLLAEFTTSTGAVVKLGTAEDAEILVSGLSRLNCSKAVVLRVVAETEEYQDYVVYVDVEETDDYDDRNDNLTVIVGGTTETEGEVEDPGEWEDPTRVFSDVPKSHWAMEAVEALYEKGIVGGIGNGKFAPNQLITREEFASMVSKAFGYAPKNTRMVFEDVRTGAWYENSVYALAENGIASGVAKYQFGVGQTITRQDMTVILYNIVKDRAVEDIRDYKNFKDQAKISSYAAEAVEFMYKAGFVSGMEDGTFSPFGGTTKAMAAYMIYSLIK